MPCFISTYWVLSEKRQLVAHLPLCKWPHGKVLPSAKILALKYSLKQENWRGLPSYPRNRLGLLSFLKLARLLLIESMKKFFSALNHRGTRDLKG